MDLSTRRRTAADKTQMNTGPAKTSNRSSRASGTPSRVSHPQKQLSSQQRRTDVASAASSSSPNKEAQNSPKKSSSGRVYVDSSRSPLYEYHPASPTDHDYIEDYDDYYGLSSSPSNTGEMQESPVEKHIPTQFAGPALRASSNGGKKAVKSANHLLNFSFPARERPTVSSYKRPQLSLAPFRRERYVQSNFRFIVSKDGEYTENLVDPDAVIDWELVEFVLCPQVEEARTCSICLEDPTCPRIAKCGHVFCWACILQLFSYHEHSSLAPCPVCLREKIRLIDLRPVIVEKLPALKAGDTMAFTLLQRPIQLNLLYPATMDPVLDSKRPLASYEYDDCARFNRIVVSSQLLDLFTIEAVALEASIAAAKSSQDLTLFMELAQQMLKEEIEQVENKIASRSTSLQSSSGSNLTASTGLLAPLTRPPSKHKLADLMPETLTEGNCFFFYQSSDGQQIFLHPLSLEYMTEEFGSDATMPPLLEEMKILDLETKTFDEKVRRKFPALSHLPISCQYHFALVDVSPLLSDAVRKANFTEDVRKRQEAIERATTREARRAEIHAQQIAAKQLEQQQKLYAARRSHTPSSLYGPAPDLLPPDLNDASFPEINALRLSAHHHSLSSPSTPSVQREDRSTDFTSPAPRSATAWGQGTLMTTLKRAPEEEFPALPPHKDKNGNFVLSEESLQSLPSTGPSAPNSRAWGQTSSSSPTPTPNAWVSRPSGSSAPSTSKSATSGGSAGTTPKKKQGKKTILVL